MAIITGCFNQGTNTNTIATSDTGNENAWDSISIGASGTLIYDNTHVNTGSLAAKVQTAGNAVTFRWSTAFGTQTDHYGRAYLYFTANPAANVQFLRNTSGATAQAFAVINSTGKIVITDAAATSKTSTNSISTGQYIRVEWHIFHNATTGIIEVKLFNTASSTTATETLTSTAANTGTSSNNIVFGNSGATTAGPFWMDDILAGAAAYPGRAVNNPNGFFSVI